MRKENLKDGMICRVGEVNYVKLGGMLFNTHGFVSLNNYTDTLEHKDHFMSKWNINAVYKPTELLTNIGCLYKNVGMNLVWEREEFNE